MVNCSTFAINRLFDLPRVTHCVFQGMSKGHHLHLSDARESLCSEGLIWSPNVVQLCFPTSTMVPYARALHKVISSKILPARNPNIVTMSRAILLMCILRGWPIDYSQTIYMQLRNHLHRLLILDQWFSNTICVLARQAGVIIDLSEEILPGCHFVRLD